jgi:integrase
VTEREKRQSPGQYGIGSVYPRADGRWVGAFLAGYTTDGKRRRITVTAKTERECRKKLERKRGDVARNGVPEQGASDRTTVKGWSEKWMADKAKRIRPNTRTAYQSSLNQAIIPTIGHRKITSLTPADVRAVATAITKAGGSSTNALHAHRVLIQLLKAAALEGVSVPNRVLLTEAPRKAVNDRQAIPVDEARAILTTARNSPQYTRWLAGMLLGIRQGEALGLTWDHVDLTAGTIDVSYQLQRLTYLDRKAGTFRVPEGYEARQLHKSLHLVRPKTSRGQRIIPIGDLLWAPLREWRAICPPSSHNLVWPQTNGQPCDAATDTDNWLGIQDRAEIAHPSGRPYKLHEMRNTAATSLLESGVDAATVMAILGHSSIVTSRSYMSISRALTTDAIARAAGRLALT